MPPAIVVAPIAELAARFVRELAQRVDATPADRSVFIAVPGGSVAEAFFPALARSSIDWSRVQIVWADERAVPPGAPASNHALARRLWLEPADIDPSHVHRMPAEEPSLRDAAETYARMLRAAAGSPPWIDIALLGVGADGHVASLFPGDASLSTTADGTVGWTTGAPKPPQARMTLTLDTLARASRVIVAAFGTEKARTIADAVSGTGEATPLTSLLRRAEHSLLLLDDAAAAQL